MTAKEVILEVLAEFSDTRGVDKTLSMRAQEVHKQLEEGALEVVDVANTPHRIGVVQCESCAWEWAAVWPEGTQRLECPICHNMNEAP